jgi:hypothetical protein
MYTGLAAKVGSERGVRIMNGWRKRRIVAELRYVERDIGVLYRM